MPDRRTLLLPCAGRSSRYPGVRPKWMLTLPDGQLALQRAAASVAKASYDRVVVAVRADHQAKYDCKALLARLFAGAVETVVLDRETRGPADTVACMIGQARITGAVAIKDSDSFFDPLPLPDTGFAAVADVRNLPAMANIGAKSFAVINGEGRIVEIVEKSLASNHVCVGLYGFADAALFATLFAEEAGERTSGEIFVSHVLNRAIARGMTVRPHAVETPVDLGTLEDWRRYVRSRGTIIVDLDGVVFRNHAHWFAPYWDDVDEPIEDNVAVLGEWSKAGAQLVFMTARPERYRARTEQTLRQLGLKPHALVMDCHHGRRFLINDHAPSNPYPAAVGISVDRDSASLRAHLGDWQ